MNKIFVVGLLASFSLFTLMGMGGNNSEPAPKPSTATVTITKPTIGVVELGRLYQESKVGQAGVEHFSKLQSTALTQLQKLQGDYQAAVEAEDDAKIQHLQIEMQGIAYSFQGIMEAEQEQAITMISSVVQQALDQYLQENDLQIILTKESVQSFAPELEITNNVMALLDTMSFDYGPGPDFSLPDWEEPAVDTAVEPFSDPVAEESPNAETSAEGVE